MSINRSAVRDKLTSILAGALGGEGGPAQAVYGYQVGDFGGQSPVVVVSSAGSMHERITFQGDKDTFSLTIHVFVVYAADGWTEEDAEDRLDLLEHTIHGIIAGNQKTDLWQSIAYGQTAADAIVVGGEEYRRETIPVQITSVK